MRLVVLCLPLTCVGVLLVEILQHHVRLSRPWDYLKTHHHWESVVEIKAGEVGGQDEYQIVNTQQPGVHRPELVERFKETDKHSTGAL